MFSSSGKPLKAWSRVICAAVSILALWWIFRRIDTRALIATLGDLNYFWFALAGVSFGLALAFAAARWHIVLALSGIAVHPMATLRTVFISHFFNTILFGPTGGDIAKTALYARWFGFRIPAVLASCALDRILGGIGFFLFASLTPLLAISSGPVTKDFSLLPSSPRIWWFAGLGVALLVVAFAARRRIRQPATVKEGIATFLAGASQIFRQPRRASQGIALSFLSHVCMSAVMLCCLTGVSDGKLSIVSILWTFPVIALVTTLPVTVAGAGLREGAALMLLGLYGIPEADAVAASLLVLAVYLVWAIIGVLLLVAEDALRERQSVAKPLRSLSIVIPVLNEAAALPETARLVKQIPEVCEIIVVDGGSTDGTPDSAAQLGCRVIRHKAGRGAQMRAGAESARGDVVVLLHADTWLPKAAGRAIFNVLRDPTVVGGGFWKVFREPSVWMTGSRVRCALRLYLWRRLAGDQVIFIRRTALERAGGVPDMPIMEEFELCRRLRAGGRLALAGETVSTSARRFLKLGVWRTYRRMWSVTTQYYLGASTQRLQRLYDKE